MDGWMDGYVLTLTEIMFHIELRLFILKG